MNISDLFNQNDISEYIESRIKNVWKDTPFEKYNLLNNVRKGLVGEKLIKKYMMSMKCPVHRREDVGHDLIINGYKCEIKISLAHDAEYNVFGLNHISLEKSWERIIFVGINHDLSKSRIVFFKKNELIEYLANQNSQSNIFRHQQGGNKVKNDDYCVLGNFEKFFNLHFVYDISEWKNKEDLRGLELCLK